MRRRRRRGRDGGRGGGIGRSGSSDCAGTGRAGGTGGTGGCEYSGVAGDTAASEGADIWGTLRREAGKRISGQARGWEVRGRVLCVKNYRRVNGSVLLQIHIGRGNGWQATHGRRYINSVFEDVIAVAVPAVVGENVRAGGSSAWLPSASGLLGTKGSVLLWRSLVSSSK